MELVRPAQEYLDSYVEALKQGWSPITTRPEASAEELEWIARDADGFLASKEDREALGPPVTLPSGVTVPRLPGFHRWMWDDGEFCGGINMRWQHGTTDLPPTCLGHAGYSVVPWKQRRGYATQALGLLLPEAREVGLPFIELTADSDNVVSQRVILSNGGEFVDEFLAPEHQGLVRRFRIQL